MLHWSLTGHSARLARVVADALGASAEPAHIPAYRGALGKLRMAADFRSRRTPSTEPPLQSVSDTTSVTLCGPAWGGRPAPAMRALLGLDDLPATVALALTCWDEGKAVDAVRHAEAVLGRPFAATIVLENRQEDTTIEAGRVAAFVAAQTR